MENSDELQHYGVKGMKWGIRRDKDERQLKRLTEKRDTIKGTVSILNAGSAASATQAKEYRAKASSLQNKSTAYASKSNALARKVTKRTRSGDERDFSSLSNKSDKFARKSEAYQKQANKYNRKASKVELNEARVRELTNSLMSDIAKYDREIAIGRKYLEANRYEGDR